MAGVMPPDIRAAIVTLPGSGLSTGELLSERQAGQAAPEHASASAVITLRIYAALWPGEEDRTRTVMDAMLGGLRTGCGQKDQATKEIAGQAA
ncbi:hypothetical protein [Streptomyces himalayensis]|uniref:hypothetical protein n=1 Tax=Streptomyces himalayensis TaxID=2820085 RepID=UPI00215DA955